MSFFSNLSVGVLAAVMTATVASAQGTASKAPRDSFALPSALPIDAAVRIGTLPNGIRYSIRRNAKPEPRAELRLVVRIGSVYEEDDEQGLAH